MSDGRDAPTPRVVTGDEEIDAVLAGWMQYDSLDDDRQAVVRDVWDSQVQDDIRSLNLAAEFRAAGRSWFEADENGDAVPMQ